MPRAPPSDDARRAAATARRAANRVAEQARVRMLIEAENLEYDRKLALKRARDARYRARRRQREGQPATPRVLSVTAENVARRERAAAQRARMDADRSVEQERVRALLEASTERMQSEMARVRELKRRRDARYRLRKLQRMRAQLVPQPPPCRGQYGRQRCAPCGLLVALPCTIDFSYRL